MKVYHDIRNLHFTDEYMELIVDGEEKKFRIREISSSLEKASQMERNSFEISPSGYGIHWPLIDEDISIDGLLGIIHEKEQREKIA